MSRSSSEPINFGGQLKCDQLVANAPRYRFHRHDEGPHESGQPSCLYVEIEGRIDLDSLRVAFQKLIEQQEALRAIVVGGVRHTLPINLWSGISSHDLRGESSAEIDRRLEQIRSFMSRHLFIASQWPRFDIQASIISDARVCVHLSVDYQLMPGWSPSSFCRDLNSLYEETAGRPLRREERSEEAKAYWSKQLNRLPAAPDLPMSDAPRKSAESKVFSFSCYLEAGVWSALQLSAERGRTSAESLLVAAYAEVINNWSRSRQFTILVQDLATPQLNVNDNSFLGTSINFHFLELDYRIERTILAVAESLRLRRREASPYSLLSCLEVMADLKYDCGLSTEIMPIVYTSFLHDPTQRGLSKSNSFPGPEFTKPLAARTQDFSLDLEASYLSDGVNVTWTYRDSIFPDGMIEQMFDIFIGLLFSLCDTPDLGEKPVLLGIPPSQSRQRQFVNSTDVALPSISVRELIRKRSILQASDPAVEYPSGCLTYGELWSQAERLANRLLEAGANVGRPIPIILDKSWEQIVAILGIMIAGAPYCPIDPSLPTARIDLLLEDLGANLIVSHRRLSNEWKKDVNVVWIETLEEDDSSPTETFLNADDLAYVIYTSGSTGNPKGVMVSQAALLNFVLDAQWRFQVRRTDRVIALTALHHDLSVFDVFVPLVAGASIIVPDSKRSRDLSHWADLLKRFRITVWNSVPALMQVFLSYLDHIGTNELITLRVVILGGDVIPPSLPTKIRQRGQMAVYSIGGPTETTVWNITFKIDAKHSEGNLIPYGRPISNTRYYVLDERKRECPDWVVGELYCSGLSLALGYWGSPELTAKKFIYGQDGETRLYATGDLGRYSADGNIEILGRLDNQIKLSGLRIEPAEIEIILNSHPEVAGSVVTMNKDGIGRRHLVAFIVTCSNPESSSDDILEFLKDRLPSQMIPTRIEYLPDFPLNSTGKVDRKFLTDRIITFPNRREV